MSKSIYKAVRADRAASGKQQLKHMFKQQWLLKEQAADCICLEFMLQLIQEQCAHMCVCVQRVEMSICLPILCSNWREDRQK